MIFPTLEFAIFFAIVLPTAWLLARSRPAWKIFMLAASYWFYAAADIRFCLLLAGSTLLNQASAIALETRRGTTRGRWILRATVTLNLLSLATFKYADFFIGSVSDLLGKFGVHTDPSLLHLALPIGISFFTFQGISYVIDVWRDDLRPAAWLDFAVYQAFFPHLVAGPIVRARELLPQLAVRRDRRSVPVTRATALILGGLFKKVVLADVIATRIVDPVFGSPGAHSAPEVILAIYGYAVQIYCDFSGYSDIAIGLALLLGIRFPINFDRPYAASSLRDFWRRWHITLSTWLRDYLYISLGGNRRGRLLTNRNLLITMLLGGLWHGAAWTFVIWGAIHGVGLVVERGIARRYTWRLRRTGAVVSRLITFHIVVIAWVFFRAPSLEIVGALWNRVWHWEGALPGSSAVTTPLVVALIIGGIAMQYVTPPVRLRALALTTRTPWQLQGVVAGVLLVVIITIVDRQGVAPFIYFRF